MRLLEPGEYQPQAAAALYDALAAFSTRPAGDATTSARVCVSSTG